MSIHRDLLAFSLAFVVILAPTVFRDMSALSTVPTFHRILALVPVLALVPSLPSLSLLSLLAFAFALAVLAFAESNNVHWVVSSWM